MKRVIIYTALCFLSTTVVLQAQDVQFSQYYQAPLYLNPGFAGITPQQRIVVNHRLQWPSLPQAFATYAISYDIFSPELRSGFGMMVTTDKMGSAGWRTTTAGIFYSYKVKLTSKMVFSPGLYFGYGNNGLDRSKIRFGDGLQYPDGQGNYVSFDPDQNKLGRHNYFDVGSGFLLYTRNWWVGASFLHMNRPNLTVLGEESRLPVKSSFHVGARLNLTGGGIRPSSGRISYLTPSAIFRTQGSTFSQLDLGLNYHVDPVAVGLWYRGKPFEKTPGNSVQQDAIILQLGLYLKNLNIGYSYDFTVSGLETATGGAHEVSLIYEFNVKPVNRRQKAKYKLIPCPTFNNNKNEAFWN